MHKSISCSYRLSIVFRQFSGGGTTNPLNELGAAYALREKLHHRRALKIFSEGEGGRGYNGCGVLSPNFNGCYQSSQAAPWWDRRRSRASR